MASGVIFAELYMIAGERQDASDFVGVATAPAVSLFKRRRGQLFTVVDPSRPGAEDICQQLIAAVEDEYFRMPSRSITRSLQAAITRGNEFLQNENARLPVDRQLRAGICCAAMRDGDVFVAQVAPATGFILHNGSVTRVFSPSVAANESGLDGASGASDSLGSRGDPHVTFGFSPVEEGDLVLLATGSNWKLIPDKYIVDAAKQIDPEIAAQMLYGSLTAHVRRPTTSMVVIKMADLPGRLGRGADDGRIRVTGDRSAGSKLREEKYPVAVVEESSLDDGFLSRSSRSRASGVSRTRSTVGNPEESQSVGGYGRKPATARPQVRRARASKGLSLWERLRLTLGRGGKPAARISGQTVTSKAAVKLRQPPPMRRERRGQTSPLAQLLLLIALVTIFVFVGNAAINLWKSWQIGDPQQLLRQAGEKQALASAADSPAAARTALVQAKELINRALQAKDDQSTRAMATSVQANLDRMDGVARVDRASTVVDLSSIIQDKGDVTQIVLDGQNLYALDEAQDRLFKYQLTADGRSVQEPGKHPLLMKKGDRVDGKPVGDLLQLAWMPAGQLRAQPALFILDSSRSMIVYDDKLGLSRVDVSDSNRWGAIQSMAGFAAGLFMLDTKQKSIYYYPATKNGYESQPYMIVDANGRADLSKAVSIALDGNLYVLEDSSTVRRFTREGRPQDFVGEVPDGKPSAPKMIFANAGTRSVYELDAGGERILQFSPDGKFQRQFKTDGKNVSFKDARYLYVDEAARRVYLLVKGAILTFDLPPMQ